MYDDNHGLKTKICGGYLTLAVIFMLAASCVSPDISYVAIWDKRQKSTRKVAIFADFECNSRVKFPDLFFNTVSGWPDIPEKCVRLATAEMSFFSKSANARQEFEGAQEPMIEAVQSVGGNTVLGVDFGLTENADTYLFFWHEHKIVFRIADCQDNFDASSTTCE